MLLVKGFWKYKNIWCPVVYERSVTVQRHRDSGNLKVSTSDLPTHILTWVGSRDAYASKSIIFSFPKLCNTYWGWAFLRICLYWHNHHNHDWTKKWVIIIFGWTYHTNTRSYDSWKNHDCPITIWCSNTGSIIAFPIFHHIPNIPGKHHDCPITILCCSSSSSINGFPIVARLPCWDLIWQSCMLPHSLYLGCASL